MDRIIIKIAMSQDDIVHDIFYHKVVPYINPMFKVKTIDEDDIAIYIVLYDQKRHRESDIIQVLKDDILDYQYSTDRLGDKTMGEAMWFDFGSDNAKQFMLASRDRVVIRQPVGNIDKLADNINVMYPDMPGNKQEQQEDGSNMVQKLRRKKYRVYNEPDSYAEQMNEGLADYRDGFSGPGTDNSFGGPYSAGKPAGW